MKYGQMGRVFWLFSILMCRRFKRLIFILVIKFLSSLVQVSFNTLAIYGLELEKTHLYVTASMNTRISLRSVQSGHDLIFRYFGDLSPFKRRIKKNLFRDLLISRSNKSKESSLDSISFTWGFAPLMGRLSSLDSISF